MRIAIFTGNYNHIADGVSLTLNRLVDFLDKQGHEVVVFGPTVSNPPVQHKGEFCEVPSIPAIGRPEYRISIGLGAAAKDRLKTLQPDIVHIATPDLLGVIGLKYALNRKIPLVATYHTHFASYLKYYGYDVLESILWKYLSWFYSKCRQLYVPSESMKDVLADVGIKSEMAIWERGIETDRFTPEKKSSEWRVENGFSEDEKIVLFVSRLVKEKGIDTIIETYKRTSSKVSWCIVGEGPAMSEMKNNMPEAIFTGKLFGEELARAYASCDIFFFPSDTETFGNVTLEAMSSGLPCVVADATGSKSLVEMNENGFLVGSNDSINFAHWIELLAVEEKIRERMSVSSRKKAEHYDWNNILNKMVTYYGAIINAE